MHDSAPNDLPKPKDDPKSTVELLGNVSVVEEESKESGQSGAEPTEAPPAGTGDSTSSAVGGDATVGEAEPMQLDAKSSQNEGPKEADGDVVMTGAEGKVGAEPKTNGNASESGTKEATEVSPGEPEAKGDKVTTDSALKEVPSATDTKESAPVSESAEMAGGKEEKKEQPKEAPKEDAATIDTSESQSAEEKPKTSLDSSDTGTADEKKTEESSVAPSVEVGSVAESKTEEAAASEPTAEAPKPAITASESKSDTGSATTNGNALPKPQETAPVTATVPAAVIPPPPVMKGTLSYDVDSKRHLIRGMWNYEHSTVFPPQRFELLRNLNPGDDLKQLPQDGEFHGSFSLAYFHTTSKGKQKERSKVIPESGVNIKFTKVDGEEGEFKVDGKGTNQFGIFHVNGTASASKHEGDPTFNVVLRKRYEPTTTPAPASAEVTPIPQPLKKSQGVGGKTASSSGAEPEQDTGPLPPPSQSFPSGVVCLRGKLAREESSDLGVTEVVQRIIGMWASGLDFVLADPENSRGLCNRFEYEHKSSKPSGTFPVSGRYSGWFDLSNEDGSRTRINERDVVLKFRKNSGGYHNVEGKGSNVFGKYSITGSLTAENIITIFRHFQPRKLKNSLKASTPSAAPVATPVAAARKPALVPAEPELKIDDVKLPAEADTAGSPTEPMKPPAHTTYSAVSRGVLRVNDDGSHTCQGKWAVTREHFTNGQTSSFHFRLEAHFAAEAIAALRKEQDEPRLFPLDSAMYKGSFQLKKQGNRYQTVVDRQVVMKFRLNAAGSYNVYGKGMNAIGEFNLMGTMIMSGKTGGQVELYRMYPPERLAAPPKPVSTTPKPSLPHRSMGASHIPAPTPGNLQRRESTRLVKLPSRLEDDDPSAQLSRTMEKCSQILVFIREKNTELGAFFSDAVDPIALGIPNYYQIIKEPMDLRTVYRKMEAEEINSPEEFSRIVRLVFENAMTFNIDPAHSVHQAARSLLIQFNQKFRDVDRMVQNIRRAQGPEYDERGKKKGKEDKKRKRDEPPKSLKRRRLEEAQAMASANSSSFAAIVSAASSTPSTSVSRSEFNMLLNHIQKLQQQMVKTHTAVAELSPGDETDTIGQLPTQSSSSYVPSAYSAPAPAPERKKAVKRKAEALIVEEPMQVIDESAPLTLDEQEMLTETINELPPEQLGGVINIIREAAPVGADEDEIDLEIDQLSAVTQRKLLRHVTKFVKKSKAKPKKKAKTSAQPAKKAPKPAAAKKTKAAPKPAPAADSFFAFGNKDDSDDSDSDEEPLQSGGPTSDKGMHAASASEFKLGDGLGDLHDDDNDDDLANGGMTATWNMAKPVTQSAAKKDGDEDDAWGAAREEAAAVKAREADRKAREEKVKADAELAKTQRLADAAARGEEIKAQRLEDEANEVLKREQQEKEAQEVRNAARDAARAQVQSVEQTVDLDAQRDIMKQYEQSFLDKDIGSASPSSDFGF